MGSLPIGLWRPRGSARCGRSLMPERPLRVAGGENQVWIVDPANGRRRHVEALEI